MKKNETLVLEIYNNYVDAVAYDYQFQIDSHIENLDEMTDEEIEESGLLGYAVVYDDNGQIEIETHYIYEENKERVDNLIKSFLKGEEEQ